MPKQWYSQWGGKRYKALRRYALVIFARPLWFADSKCRPCYLQTPRRSIYLQWQKNWQICNTFRSCALEKIFILIMSVFYQSKKKVVIFTCVCLETFAFRVIPQLERVVECRCQNVLAIRTKFYKWHRWVVVVYQSFQALPRGCVPDAAEAVVRGRNDQRAIPVEMDSTDWVTVGGQRFQAFACADIPNAYTLVEWATDNQIWLQITNKNYIQFLQTCSFVLWQRMKYL